MSYQHELNGRLNWQPPLTCHWIDDPLRAGYGLTGRATCGQQGTFDCGG
ncbi:hypothetical protein GGD40_004368 [Paraburkholderia bryophila]|uniref:Uncharacterized protein n=1 Tax=Paraburkholderia bryophila TaxID=420952 RepID=A0A7Y9WQE4_9BURK|nr:hypothetical protein [Paraburkholderia bryophila]